MNFIYKVDDFENEIKITILLKYIQWTFAKSTNQTKNKPIKTVLCELLKNSLQQTD